MKQKVLVTEKHRKITNVFLSLLYSAIFLSFFNGCKDKVIESSETPSNIEQPFYTEDYTMPHTQSPQLLSDFMTSQHLNYHVFGWDIFANLVNDKNESMAFFFALERVDPTCRAGIGFNNKNTNGFKLGGLTNTVMEVTASPWSTQITSSDKAQAGRFIKMELVSGLMGAANTVYRLTADVTDLEGKSLKADVRLRDPFGVVNQGYGTASFFPHYITESQRTNIMGLPEKTISAYLTATGDKMTCQGDYYYAIPLMQVEQYSIQYDGTILSGSSGKSWMDYFVQSFSATSLEMTKGAKWDWVAIQLPEINTAFNVLKITSNVGGVLPTVRVFNMDGERTKNGARKAFHTWQIDEIEIEPTGPIWISPVSGMKYSLQFHIRLKSLTYSADLTVKMVQENQEVILPESAEYQGLGTVEGTLGGQAVHGQCWLEVQPVGL